MSTTAEDFDREEDIPFEISEAVSPDDIGDLADQKPSGGDAIEPAKDVLFTIRKARLDKSEDGGKVLVRSLKVEAEIAQPGIPIGEDDEGNAQYQYAGKVFFPEFILKFDIDALEEKRKQEIAEARHQNKKLPKPFNKDWWTKSARVPTQLFMPAIGAAIWEPQEDGTKKWKMVCPVDDQFLSDLKGKQFVADVQKRKDDYRTTDPKEPAYKNELVAFRAPVSEDGEDE